jgi:hypothetical protein
MQEGDRGGGDEGEDHSLREKTRSGMGVAVSTMVCPDDDLSDRDKTAFHWCQEGQVDKVKAMISQGQDVNQLDEQVRGHGIRGICIRD